MNLISGDEIPMAGIGDRSSLSILCPALNLILCTLSNRVSRKETMDQGSTEIVNLVLKNDYGKMQRKE